MDTSRPCPICRQTRLQPAFRAVVLHKFPCVYCVCSKCGFLSADNPHWLVEAYRNPLADSDTGTVVRNLKNRRLSEAVLNLLYRCQGKYLDLGGGYGMLTRMLRDIGIDCYATDKYCENIFARGYEPDETFRATAILCFEVLEHLEDPVGFLIDAVRMHGCRTVFLSTTTYSKKVPGPEWEYYSFHSGQHVSFFTPTALERIADQLGGRYIMLNRDYHLITDRALSRFDRIVLSSKRTLEAYRLWVRLLRRNKSLTKADEARARRYGGTSNQLKDDKLDYRGDIP